LNHKNTKGKLHLITKQQKMKIKLFTILAITLICGNSFAQSSHKTVIELIEKSGLTGVFQQLEEMVNAQITEKKSSFEKEEDFNKFTNAIKSGFNSKNAEDYFVEYFELNTNEDSLRSIIKLYEHPLMQEMQKIELAANDSAKQQEMLTFFQGLKDNPPSQERTQQLVTLNNELGTSEMTIKVIENMISSMAKGMNDIQPKEKQIPQNELEQKISSSLPTGFSQQMANQIVAVYMFTYKDVSDAKLNEYIGVWQTSTGRYCSRNTLKALDYSFSKMGEIIGNSFKVFVK